MSNKQNMENTTVEKIDIDIDEIFGAGVGNITLPEENKKPNIFERPNQNVDFSFAESPKDEDLKNEYQDKNDCQGHSVNFKTTKHLRGQGLRGRQS
jgi:hypothetical protein